MPIDLINASFRCVIASNSKSAKRHRLVLLLAAPLLLAGCARFEPHPPAETVYVVVRQTYLRDRVAPVASHTALVVNGEPLQALEHVKRFYRVRTRSGATGWIEDHLVIDQQVHNEFVQLREENAHDPVVATAILRDDLYLHLKPGRETERYYLLPENDRLNLLARASVERENSQPPRMEDWWLARDSKDHTGWLLSREIDVDVPDEIDGYSEGQKLVGAYVLTHVEDEASSFPDHRAPIYLAIYNSYQDGLPYDFNQIRVFTWNVRKHRYETAYRQRGIEGYLPVEVAHRVIGDKENRGEPVPVFSIRVATSDAVTRDPKTGAMKPAQSEVLEYALEGPIVKRISPDTGVKPISSRPLPSPKEKRRARKRSLKGGG